MTVQFDFASLNAAFNPNAAQDREAVRQGYLARNYVPCSIPRCDGLAGPAYVHLIPDVGAVAICGRFDAHRRIVNPTVLRNLTAAWNAAPVYEAPAAPAPTIALGQADDLAEPAIEAETIPAPKRSRRKVAAA